MQDDKLILIGVISSAHGIKGHVVIKSFTSPTKNIENLQVFDQEKIPIKLKILKVKANSDLICSIENCYTRNDAEKLVKKSLYCLRSSLPEISNEDEFYIEDLVGLSVLDQNGNNIGNITHVANYGAGDIIEVKFTKDGSLQMFPFTKEHFPQITKNHVVLIL